MSMVKTLHTSHSNSQVDPPAVAPAAGAAAPPAAVGAAGAATTIGKPEVFEKKKDKLLLFNNKDKLVLPMYCKSKLDAKEIYGLSTHASDYVGAWREAGATPDAKAEDLPQLDPPAFAKYYAKITENMLMDAEMLGSKEAEAKADDLAFTINFQNSNLKKVSWFQWWIFLCSAGVTPAKHEYQRNEPADEEMFLKKLKSGMGIHKNAKSRKFYRMRGRSHLHSISKNQSHSRK